MNAKEKYVRVEDQSGFNQLGEVIELLTNPSSHTKMVDIKYITGPGEGEEARFSQKYIEVNFQLKEDN